MEYKWIVFKKLDSFTADPFLHGDKYDMQKVSFMFLKEMLNQTWDITKPLSVLDFCALSDLKFTLLQSIIF